jgi:multidrug resistance efflux pump
MDANEKSLTLFQTRVRQMILKFSELKKENEELYAMVDQKEAEVKQLKAQLTQAQNDYNSLKMARMLEVTDGDLEGAKARVAKMIREVDKAIKLLSAE